MVFKCINIRQVPWEVLKTAASGLGFQHLHGTWRMLRHEKPCLIPIVKLPRKLKNQEAHPSQGTKRREDEKHTMAEKATKNKTKKKKKKKKQKKKKKKKKKQQKKKNAKHETTDEERKKNCKLMSHFLWNGQ